MSSLLRRRTARGKRAGRLAGDGVAAALVMIVAAPSPAAAYIDPGLVSMVVQGVFALVAGVVTAWFVRPWSFIKGWFRRGRAGGADRRSGDGPAEDTRS